MRKFLLSIIVLICGEFIYAQSAEVVTEILNTKAVTYGQVCYLSAVQQGLVSDDATYEQAIKALKISEKKVKSYDADDKIKLQDLAYIYVRMWPKAKGGIMFFFSGGSPRYSFKLLKNKGIILSYGDPEQHVTGQEALNILTACMMEFGTEEDGVSLSIEDPVTETTVATGATVVEEGGTE